MPSAPRNLDVLLLGVLLLSASVSHGVWRVRHPLPARAAASASAERGPPRPGPLSVEAMKIPASREGRFEAGGELFQKYCALCHGASGTGYAADNAPSLVSTTFLESATDAYLAQGIRLGRPETAMGAYGRVRGGPLAEDQINAIIAWLREDGPAPITLPPMKAAGDAKRGETVFTEYCQRCHGTKEARGDALQLSNRELIAAATDPFLRWAVVHGRPGTRMEPMAGRLDDQQIDDVVATIRSWAPANPWARPPVEVPKDLTIILNPNGPRPKFTLREGLYVSAAEVKKALDDRSRIVIIDARTPSEWIQLRIPGALPVPYHDLVRADELPRDGTFIVAYCACPHHASGAVIEALRKRGFPATAVLDEGIMFWKQHGYPIAGESVTAAVPSAQPPR